MRKLRAVKVVEITGKRACAVVDRPDPTVRGNYALVKILVAPMCTEVGDYRNGDTSDCLWHEAAGEVVEVARPGMVAVGDKVVVMPQDGCGKCEWCLAGEHVHCPAPRDPYAVCGCTTGRATYAQYCIQQDWLLWPVPEGMSIEQASMACCGLGPTFNAVRSMRVDSLDCVLVSGLGPVGLGGVVNARVLGARVIGIESNPYRAELAKKLGAEAVVDPGDPDAVAKIRALTGGRGADKSIEASSAETAPALVAQATRIGGELTSVGWGGPIRMADAVYRGLTIRGAWHWNHLREGPAMAQTLRKAGPLLDHLVTHRFPIDRVQDAWELQSTGNCGKVVLHPWD
jgi:threonine dehydrogenase-like Zn-dependent dehydrogenase